MQNAINYIEQGIALGKTRNLYVLQNTYPTATFIELGNMNHKQNQKRFLIAEVPIEEDGSFYVQIPSKTSFDIQSLNSRKMALRTPNRWLYCQPGEKHSLSTPRNLFTQSCAGCHGSLTGAREDVTRRPDAISGASRTLSFWNEEQQKVV